MGDLPEEIDVPTSSIATLKNVRFLPLTLETVTVYIDGNVYVNNGILTTQNNYRVFNNPYPLPVSSYSSVVFTSSGYDYSTLEGPLDENETYTITLHPAVAIPNITINGSDYWNTHKSEYNALIGNPVGTFKLDLSEYATNSTVSITDPSNLYNYVDINGNEIVNYTVNKDSMKNLMVRILPKSSS